MRRLFGILPAAALMLSGCAGYHVGPCKPTAMREVRVLAVPSFKNLTLEPRTEVSLANAVIKKLQQDGTYRVAREEDADAILQGSVEKIDRSPSRGVRTDYYQTSEYILSLVVNIKVVEKQTGKVLAQRSFTGNSSFFVSGSNLRTADVNTDERQAIPNAAEDAATRMVSYLTEGW